MYLKKMGYFFLLILSFILMPLNVWAKDETQINITSSQTHVDVGQDLEIKTEISTTKNLYALTATLSYDYSVFEEITPEDFILANEVLDLSYNNATNKFGIVNKVGLISGELFQIHLKAKQNANVGNTNIALTNITSSDGENKITYEKEVLQVLVTKNAQENEVINNTKPNEITEVKDEVIKVFTNKPILIELGIGSLLALGGIIFICLFILQLKFYLI